MFIIFRISLVSASPPHRRRNLYLKSQKPGTFPWFSNACAGVLLSGLSGEEGLLLGFPDQLRLHCLCIGFPWRATRLSMEHECYHRARVYWHYIPLDPEVSIVHLSMKDVLSSRYTTKPSTAPNLAMSKVLQCGYVVKWELVQGLFV